MTSPQARRFGWLEGKNIRIDWRFGAGNPGHYNTYAEELVGLSPDAIFAIGLVEPAKKGRGRTRPFEFQ